MNIQIDTYLQNNVNTQEHTIYKESLRQSEGGKRHGTDSPSWLSKGIYPANN